MSHEQFSANIFASFGNQSRQVTVSSRGRLNAVREIIAPLIGGLRQSP